MAHSIESQANSPLAILREDLGELEKLLVKINEGHVIRTLELLDRCAAAMATLRDQGVDLKGEEGLWAGFERKLNDSAGQVVKAARPHGGLAALRAAHADADGFWWHLDENFRQQTRQQLKKMALWVGLVVGVVALIYVVMTYIIPPDESTVIVTTTVYDLESHVEAGNWEAALAVVEANLDASQRSEELLIWAGVLQEALGATEIAGDYYNEVLDNPSLPDERVWATIGTNRLRLGDLEGAECGGQAALDLDPEFPQGHFLIASVAEAMGNAARAVEHFNLTAEYAYDTSPQMAVIARVRLGYLMQNPAITGGDQEAPEFDCTFPRGSD